MSEAAVAKRLRAARIVAGFDHAKDFAEALEIPYQTYYSQETKGRPSKQTVGWLYRNHRIDFNFVFFGDLFHLPGDVRTALETALAA